MPPEALAARSLVVLGKGEAIAKLILEIILQSIVESASILGSEH